MPFVKFCFFVGVPVLVLAAFLSPEEPKAKKTTSTDPSIAKMKACATKLKKERAQWFFDETGILLTGESGSKAAQAYVNQMQAQNMPTKSPLPFRDCSNFSLNWSFALLPLKQRREANDSPLP